VHRRTFFVVSPLKALWQRHLMDAIFQKGQMSSYVARSVKRALVLGRIALMTTVLVHVLSGVRFAASEPAARPNTEPMFEQVP
jgi:hypothetical protein